MVGNNVGNRKIRVLFAKGSWKALGPLFHLNYLQAEHMLLLIMHLIFILLQFFLGDAVALLQESYMFLYRRSYVSSINLITSKFLEFSSFVHSGIT